MRLSYLPFLLLPTTFACNHENMARQANNNASMPFNYIEGSDSYDAVDVAATQSYFVNHIGLMVSNITASREWYTKVLGMRHVFTFELANKFNVMYMAHTQGGRNGTGFQEGKELVRDKNNLAGLIEFMEYIVGLLSFKIV